MEWDAAQPKGHWDLSKFVPVEVKAGACVVLDGSNVHCSYENRSAVRRAARLAWQCNNDEEQRAPREAIDDGQQQ